MCSALGAARSNGRSTTPARRQHDSLPARVTAPAQFIAGTGERNVGALLTLGEVFMLPSTDWHTCKASRRRNTSCTDGLRTRRLHRTLIWRAARALVWHRPNRAACAHGEWLTRELLNRRLSDGQNRLTCRRRMILKLAASGLGSVTVSDRDASGRRSRCRDMMPRIGPRRRPVYEIERPGARGWAWSKDGYSTG